MIRCLCSALQEKDMKKMTRIKRLPNTCYALFFCFVLPKRFMREEAVPFVVSRHRRSSTHADEKVKHVL